MGIHHRGAHVSVPQQFLDRSDVIAVFQKVSGKAIPQRVATGWLDNARFDPRFLKRPLQNRFMVVVTALFSRGSFRVMAGCRKHPLPTPLLARVGVLALQRAGHDNTPKPFLQICFMLALDGMEMSEQRLFESGREHGVAILVTFA